MISTTRNKKPTGSNTQPTNFLNLPRELRHQILQLSYNMTFDYEFKSYQRVEYNSKYIGQLMFGHDQVME